MAWLSSRPLPGSVVPLWAFLAISIPLLLLIFYLKYHNLTKRFLLQLYCPPRSSSLSSSSSSSSGASLPSPYYSILSSILVSRPYHPPYYHIMGIEYHGQLQTAMQFLLRRLGYYLKGFLKLKRVEYDRELLTLSDQGLVGLDWGYYIDKQTQQRVFNENSKNLIILQHGLGGNSKSEYIVHLAERFLDSSYQVVALVARGCGGLPIKTHTFVPRKTNDLREIIQHIRKTRPHIKNIYYVGYSLGAALGIKYVHEEGKKCPLKGAVAISPPWNMAEHTIVYPLWSRMIVKVLHRYLYKHRHILPNCGVTYDQVKAAKNLTELDKLLIKSYGYSSLEAYYHDNSAIHYTTGIEIPTLVISSEDDPICSIASHPTATNGNHGPGLCFLKTSTGGHCAYPQGPFPISKSWVDDVILDWVYALETKQGK